MWKCTQYNAKLSVLCMQWQNSGGNSVVFGRIPLLWFYEFPPLCSLGAWRQLHAISLPARNARLPCLCISLPPLSAVGLQALWKDYGGKNGDLIKHVELIDAGIQPWTHLNYDTKYSWEGPRLMNGYFLSLSGTNPKGCPKPWVSQPQDLLFLFSVPFSLLEPIKSSACSYFPERVSVSHLKTIELCWEVSTHSIIKLWTCFK